MALPLASRLLKANLSQRISILSPFLGAGLLLLFGSTYFAQRSIEVDNNRENALRELSAVIPEQETIAGLKAEVETLRQVVPPDALKPVQFCQTIEIKGENGPIQRQQCQETPSKTAIALEKINSTLDTLSSDAGRARGAIRQIRLSGEYIVGLAYADDEDFPSARDKANVMYIILSVLAISTIACFVILFGSKNSRVVTWAIDTLKLLFGFYTGFIGGIFGLKK